MSDIAGPFPVPDEAVPNVARMYDYMLGGKDNYACDRVAVAKLEAMAPAAPLNAQLNRKFLGRAVRYVAGQGIRQFLDVGAGLPTQENVHQVAQAVAPDARTVYVDNDPVVLVHARALLATDVNTVVVEGDVRDPAGILGDPRTTELLDLSKPLCVLLVAILHFIRDAEDPAGIIRAFRDAIAPGSYLILSHATMDGAPPQQLAREDDGKAVYDRANAPLVMRGPCEVGPFLDGFTLVEPGLVHITRWRPGAPYRGGFDAFLGAVGRKD